MLVQMELHRIIISDIRDQQVVYLREIEGQRSFPILIGIFEATSIDRRVKGEVPPRPLTHGLLKNAIEEMGGEAQDVIINNLVDHTYYAVIRIRKDGELIQVDSRPSDAIALAVQFNPPLPIYVEESVLDEVT
ncbi:MAG TPA: bifunctional nuclease family protein [Planctomycetaceae bacterium]|nr:bifunctional nuclease family protein [Planctomycetaceae bacterium]